MPLLAVLLLSPVRHPFSSQIYWTIAVHLMLFIGALIRRHEPKLTKRTAVILGFIAFAQQSGATATQYMSDSSTKFRFWSAFLQWFVETFTIVSDCLVLQRSEKLTIGK
jgi:hypothetical protein